MASSTDSETHRGTQTRKSQDQEERPLKRRGVEGQERDLLRAVQNHNAEEETQDEELKTSKTYRQKKRCVEEVHDTEFLIPSRRGSWVAVL